MPQLRPHPTKSRSGSHRRARFAALLGVALIAWSPSAQTADSVRVSGGVRWGSESVDHLPQRVTLQSRYDPTSVWAVPVDTAGRYQATVPPGTYRIRPFNPYHWRQDWGQGFVRVDEAVSYVDVGIPAGPIADLPELVVDSLGHEARLPEEGVLLDGFGPEERDALDAFVTYNLDYYGVPGASLVVLEDGAVVYERSYGVENPLTREPVDETTLFEAGSITKPVFAFVVMRLVEQGRFDLDRPLYEILPFEDVAHDDRYRLITARHVLTHQTGFPNWADRDSTGRFDLLFTPGTQFGYSGEGFEYLKRAVVHALDTDIETLLDEELVAPLGLDGYYFRTTDVVRARAADGFRQGTPTRIREVEEPGMAYSLMTNAVHFAAFALAMRNRLGLSDASYDEVFRPQVTQSEDLSRGLGFELGTSDVGEFYGHSGITSDFVSIYRYYPELDLGFAFFANSLTGGWLTIDTLKRFLVEGAP